MTGEGLLGFKFYGRFHGTEASALLSSTQPGRRGFEQGFKRTHESRFVNRGYITVTGASFFLPLMPEIYGCPHYKMFPPKAIGIEPRRRYLLVRCICSDYLSTFYSLIPFLAALVFIGKNDSVEIIDSE